MVSEYVGNEVRARFPDILPPVFCYNSLQNEAPFPAAHSNLCWAWGVIFLEK